MLSLLTTLVYGKSEEMKVHTFVYCKLFISISFKYIKTNVC